MSEPMSLSGAVAALYQTSVLLTEASGRAHTHDPGAVAFGGNGSGRLGELGRLLHRQWQGALDARAREAAAHGARVEDVADGLARAAARYADIDHSTSKQHPEVS